MFFPTHKSLRINLRTFFSKSPYTIGVNTTRVSIFVPRQSADAPHYQFVPRQSTDAPHYQIVPRQSTDAPHYQFVMCQSTDAPHYQFVPPNNTFWHAIPTHYFIGKMVCLPLPVPVPQS